MHEFNFKKANFEGLNAYLSLIDWDIEISGNDIDDVVDKFYELLKVGFERFVPTKEKLADTHPPWYSKTLLNLKNRKSRAHKKSKDGNVNNYIKFCSLRNQFDASQSRAYQSYLDATQENLVKDPSKFWSYVNAMKKTTGYPC